MKSKISFKGKNKVLLEGLGQGGSSGLAKLNELMETELSNLNHMKKLFKYLQNAQNIKKEFKIENITKVIRNFPEPEILEIFVHRFRLFHDLPHHIRKQVLIEIEPLEFGF